MALISKVTNLFSVANNAADKLSTVAKGVLCIPSILSNLPSILGGVASNILSTITGQITNVINGLTSLVTSLVNEALSEITGTVSSILSKVLQLQATILGTIKLAKEFLDGLATRGEDIINFAKNEENCKFAAAELLNCIASSVLGDINKKIARDINKGIVSAQDVIRNSTSKIARPGQVLDGYVNKIGKSVDKATSQISAISIF